MYICDKCFYKTTQQGNLKIHNQTVHEGVTNMCNATVCDNIYPSSHPPNDNENEPLTKKF